MNKSMNQRIQSAVSVNEYGAAGDGLHDDAQAIQAALDSGARKVLIPAGTFLISNAIAPRAHQDIEILGTLKVADAHIQGVTADVAAGQPQVEVADASGYRVGQWVTVCDDDSPRWQTRIHADCGRIAAIEGNVLRMEGRFTLPCRVTAHARVTTHHSAIWINEVSSVRIHGSGTIDGNNANQLDVRPTVMDGCGLRGWTSIGGVHGEEIRAGAGIAASGKPGSLEHIVIEGITIRDANEHNLCLAGLVHGRIQNTVCTGARDKNITLLDSHDCLIAGNIASFSVHEDGIMLHQKTGNYRLLIQGNICKGNPRIGLSVGTGEDDIHLSGNLCVDNGCNLSITGAHCSSTGDVCRGENYKRFPRNAPPPGAIFAGQDTLISNLSISGDRLVFVELMGEDCTWIGGRIRGARTAGDNVGMWLGKSGNGGDSAPDPTRIVIKDVSIEACHTGVLLHGKMQAVRLADNRFFGNDRAVEFAPDFAGAVAFARNSGFQTEAGGSATIPPGRTSVTVQHGLDRAPALHDIRVTPANSLGQAAKFWLANPTAAGFDIMVDCEPGGGGAVFSWCVGHV